MKSKQFSRPWGYYETLAGGDNYQVKRIVVKPKQRLSLQKHQHRAEHWVVVSGDANVVCDDKNVVLKTNQNIYLPVGCVHRLENLSESNLLVLIEVQSGHYLGEDDIIRLDDDYDRS